MFYEIKHVFKLKSLSYEGSHHLLFVQAETMHFYAQGHMHYSESYLILSVEVRKLKTEYILIKESINLKK